MAVEPSPTWPYAGLPTSGRDVVTQLSTPPPASMFRETDVRGLVDAPFDLDPSRLTPLNANVLGRALGTYMHASGVAEVVVGYDSRAYAPLLAGGMIEGLLSTGMHVVALGMSTTPMVYFAQHHLSVAGGVSVTASHNPNGWGGFKMSLAPSTTLGPKEVIELHEIAKSGEYRRGVGSYVERSVVEDYVDSLAALVPAIGDGLDIAIDGANAIAGPVMAMAFERAGHKATLVNAEMDWLFPNHEPDPELADAREQLNAAVVAGGHDLGVALDGDGDRLGVSDELGGTVLSDRTLALLAADVLSRHPGGTIVYDVKCSRLVADVIKDAGGVPLMWRTGHSHIKSKMKEVEAVFAGERSGHFFNAADHHGYDDAVYSGLRLAQYIERGGASVSELIGKLPAYKSSPTMHVDCPDDRKYDVVDEVIRIGTEKLGADEVVTINGARFEFERGWFLVRASSNVPALVVVCEGLEENDLAEMYASARTLLDPIADVAAEWHGDPWGPAAEH